MKFRKKPVVIDAIEFIVEHDGRNNSEYAARWCGGCIRSEAKAGDPTDVAYWLDIPTLEGVMAATPGDWIIRGVQGEFYPCKPDIFDATYEPVVE